MGSWCADRPELRGITWSSTVQPRGRGQPLTNNAYGTAWRKAREAALTPAQQRRRWPAGRTAVSLWLNAGVPEPRVAEWAGKRRIEAALRSEEEAHDPVGG